MVFIIMYFIIDNPESFITFAVCIIAQNPPNEERDSTRAILVLILKRYDSEISFVPPVISVTEADSVLKDSQPVLKCIINLLTMEQIII